jgi:hypothetical protein
MSIGIVLPMPAAPLPAGVRKRSRTAGPGSQDV